MPSIDVRREDMAAALRAIGQAKASDPPYAHLTKLTLGPDEVHVEGCRPETRAESTVAATVDAPAGAEVFLPRDALARCTENAADDSVTLTGTDSAKVQFACGSFTSSLPTGSCSTWPRWAPVDGPDLEVSVGDWRQILRVRFAASDDQMHPMLLGIHLDGSTAAATDKKRVAQARLANTFPPVTVPKDFLAHIDRFVDQDCAMRVSPGHLAVSVGRNRWTTTLLPKGYPSLDAHLVMRSEQLLTVSASDLRASLDRISVFGRDTSAFILEVATADSLCVTALGPEAATASDRLACSGTWTGTVAFTPAVLSDAIAAAAVESVSFGMVLDPLKPVLVRQPDFVQLLMPTRV